MSPAKYARKLVLRQLLPLALMLCLFMRLETHNSLAQIGQGIVSLALSPDGTSIAVGGTNGLLKIIDATTGADEMVFSGFTGTVSRVSWDPDGSRIASAHGGDSNVRVWNVSSGALLATLPQQSSYFGAQGAAFSPNGQWLAAFSFDETSALKIYHADTLSEICSVHIGATYELDWHPNGNVLALGGHRGVEIVNVPSSCQVTRITGGEFYSIAYNTDGNRLAVGQQDGQILILNAVTGAILQSFQPHSDFVNALEWYPSNNQFLASAGQDNRVRVSNLISGAITETYTISQEAAILGMAFRGTNLLYGDGTTVHQVAAFPTTNFTGNVTLQGRTLGTSAYSVPLAFELYYPSGSLAQGFNPLTDINGYFTIQGVPQGSYSAWVKYARSLANLQTVNLDASAVSANLGTLRMGDANDDNRVIIGDFSILAATFGKIQGDPGYDARADFNGDNAVTILDFASLAANFGQVGAERPSSGGSMARIQPLTTGTVRVSISPSISNLRPNRYVDVTVQVRADTQPVDSAAAYIDFDPAKLYVMSITSGSTLSTGLQSSYNNTTGQINYAAGSLSSTPSGTFTLLTIRFGGRVTGDSTVLTFASGDLLRETDALLGGNSVFQGADPGTINLTRF